jgi:hypothetical protein
VLTRDTTAPAHTNPLPRPVLGVLSHACMRLQTHAAAPSNAFLNHRRNHASLHVAACLPRGPGPFCGCRVLPLPLPVSLLSSPPPSPVHHMEVNQELNELMSTSLDGVLVWDIKVGPVGLGMVAHHSIPVRGGLGAYR